MAKKPIDLGNLIAPKGTAARPADVPLRGAEAPAPTPAARPSEHQAEEGQGAAPRKGQTVRLTPAAWKALKLLAIDQGCTAHDLIVAGINAVFEKHGRPPIA